MDPQLKSIVTSLLKDGVTGVGVVLVSHGWLSASNQAQFVSYVMGLALIGISQGITWYKQRQVSPKVMIKQINEAENGLKVVPAMGPGPMMHEPIKETKQ